LSTRSLVLLLLLLIQNTGGASEPPFVLSADASAGGSNVVRVGVAYSSTSLGSPQVDVRTDLVDTASQSQPGREPCASLPQSSEHSVNVAAGDSDVTGSGVGSPDSSLVPTQVNERIESMEQESRSKPSEEPGTLLLSSSGVLVDVAAGRSAVAGSTIASLDASGSPQGEKRNDPYKTPTMSDSRRFVRRRMHGNMEATEESTSTPISRRLGSSEPANEQEASGESTTPPSGGSTGSSTPSFAFFKMLADPNFDPEYSPSVPPHWRDQRR